MMYKKYAFAKNMGSQKRKIYIYDVINSNKFEKNKTHYAWFRPHAEAARNGDRSVNFQNKTNFLQ